MDTRTDGQTQNKGIMSALLFGAAMGAAAVILSDKDKRTQVKNRLTDMVENGKEKMNEMRGKAEEKMEEGRALTAQKLDDAKQRVEPWRKRPNG